MIGFNTCSKAAKALLALNEDQLRVINSLFLIGGLMALTPVLVWLLLYFRAGGHTEWLGTLTITVIGAMVVIVAAIATIATRSHFKAKVGKDGAEVTSVGMSAKGNPFADAPSGDPWTGGWGQGPSMSNGWGSEPASKQWDEGNGE